jgi:hypothetical protein
MKVWKYFFKEWSGLLLKLRLSFGENYQVAKWQ